MQCRDTELFYSKKNTLHQEYIDQLDKTMKEYPAFKMEKENSYPEELSTLNGITKKLDDLQTLVREKTLTVDRVIEQNDVDIRKLKNVERNLSNYTSYEELDITSQQLLADAVQEYRQEKTIFFLKGVVILFLLYLLYKRIKLGSWMETSSVIGCTILLFIVSWLYL
jgi:hypothetical protein